MLLRRVAFGLLCIGLSPVLPAQAASRGYTITDLGTLGGAESHAFAINNAGDVVGAALTEAGERHAFLYSGGVMHDLGTLGGASSTAYAINDAGQVVGESETAAGETHAFLYTHGTMYDLGTLGGTFSQARAINSDGEVAGVATTADGLRHACLYHDGEVVDLDPLGAESAAYGINDEGDVVGLSGTRAAFYSDGETTDLGIADSEARDVNDAGDVAGAMMAGSVKHAFLQSRGVATDLGVLDFASYALGLNAAGDVVGYGTNVQENAVYAFLYSGGVMHDLLTLAPADSGWVALRTASAINDAGAIAGTGIRSGGEWHAFVLSPVSETPTNLTDALDALSKMESSHYVAYAIDELEEALAADDGLAALESMRMALGWLYWADEDLRDETAEEQLAIARAMGLMVRQRFEEASADGAWSWTLWASEYLLDEGDALVEADDPLAASQSYIAAWGYLFDD